MKQESIQRAASNKHLPGEIRNVRGRYLQSQSHTLTNIIRSARMIIVAPLIAGAYQIPTLISTGQYLSAVQCALVAGLSFLILTCALGLADFAMGVIERKRGGGKLVVNQIDDA